MSKDRACIPGLIVLVLTLVVCIFIQQDTIENNAEVVREYHELILDNKVAVDFLIGMRLADEP